MSEGSGPTEAAIEEELASFSEELDGEIEEKREIGFLRKKPTIAQKKVVLQKAREIIAAEDYPDPEEFVVTAFPDCLHPAAKILSDPDVFSAAQGIREDWTNHFEFLSDDLEDGTCIQDVIKKPSLEQIGQVWAVRPDAEQADLARQLVAMFPDFQKQNAKAHAFFNPGAARKVEASRKRKKKKGGCFETVIGIAVMAVVIYVLVVIIF